MVGKRHAAEEITAKLAHASELAARGKTQREISKALGVSIMTYHRWKKLVGDARSVNDADDRPVASLRGAGAEEADLGTSEKIRRLEVENAQLRRLVADMLLEKLQLEDELKARQDARTRR